MSPSLLFVSLFELGLAGLCLVVAAIAWAHRRQPAGPPLVLLSLAAAGWGLTAGLASLVAGPTLTRWAQYGTYLFVGPTAVCWFYVVVAYTGRSWWSQRSVLAVVFGSIALQWLAILTDPIHHLTLSAASHVGPAGVFDPTPGPLLWGVALLNAGFVVAGTSLLVHTSAGGQGLLRSQPLAVLIAGLLPFAASVIELFDLLSVRGLDITTVGLAAGSGLILWALFYASFLDIRPIARQTLFEQISDPAVALDVSGRVVDLNTPAKTLFETDSELIGRSAIELFDGTSLSVAALVAATDPIEMSADSDGKLRQYEITVSPITTPSDWRADETQIGSLLLFRDVTDSKRYADDLVRKNTRLEEFSSIVSHDLRNPLNVAQGRMALAREERDSEHFAAIDRSLDRMGTLIDDLLLLARKGKVVTEAEPVDIAALARDCWENVATGEATLVVETEQTLSADPSRLQESLENLLRNSVQHGGPTVTITVGDLGDRPGFFVADDGSGIPETDRDRIFESGYSKSDDGTGLGLAIVAEIARAHGWTVTLTESEDGGARFEFDTDHPDA